MRNNPQTASGLILVNSVKRLFRTAPNIDRRFLIQATA
nr:MAG TPA: hypothetical protein [Caudoviricetes sp.]